MIAEAARNFLDTSNLYVEYWFSLPPGWHVLPSGSSPSHQPDQLMSGRTQKCFTNPDYESHFGHPLELSLHFSPPRRSTPSPNRGSTQKDQEGSRGDDQEEQSDKENRRAKSSAKSRQRSKMMNWSALKWPQLYVHVISIDSWGIERSEGYGQVRLPNRPGRRTLSILTWKPVASTVQQRLTDYFLGGVKRLTAATSMTSSNQMNQQKASNHHHDAADSDQTAIQRESAIAESASTQSATAAVGMIQPSQTPSHNNEVN